jgi:hypothetical protein
LAETRNPSMLTLEALVVCQVSVTIWPLSISAGTAVRDAVGVAGGVAGGGSLFLLPPPHALKVTESKTTREHCRSVANRTGKPI